MSITKKPVDLFGDLDIVDPSQVLADPGVIDGSEENPQVGENFEEEDENIVVNEPPAEPGDAPDAGDDDSGEQVKVVAEYWKSLKLLPDDFDPSSVDSFSKLEETYRSSLEKKIRDEVEATLEVELRDKGYDAETLEYARLLRQGVSPELLSDANLYSYYGGLEIDTDTDEGVDIAKDLVREFYKEKGFKEDRIEKLISKEFGSFDFQDTLEEAQQFFKEKAQSMIEAEKKAIEDKKKEEEDNRKKNLDRFKGYLDKGEIGGVKYSQEEMDAVRKALFDKSEVWKDSAGKIYRVTGYQKRMLEIQNDPELTFQYMVNTVLGYKKQDLMEEAKKDVNSEILTALGATTTKIKQAVRPGSSLAKNIIRREINLG